MSLEVHEQKHGAVTVLRPEGAMVDQELVPLRQRVDQVRRQNMGRLVLDLSSVPFADSQGLETLLDVTERMSRGGQVLKLCGVNETVREALEVTGLAPRFEHYEDVNSAVRSFL